MEEIIFFIHRLMVAVWVGAIIGEVVLAGKGGKAEEGALDGLLENMKKVYKKFMI